MKWFNSKSKPKTESTDKTPAKIWETELSNDVLAQIAGGRFALSDCHGKCK